MPKSFTPLYDFVLICLGEVEEKTKSGLLYVPDVAKDMPAHGEVIAVGHGKLSGDMLIPLTLKVGDKVIFGRYAGSKVDLGDNKEYIVTRECDVLGVLKDA